MEKSYEGKASSKETTTNSISTEQKSLFGNENSSPRDSLTHVQSFQVFLDKLEDDNRLRGASWNKEREMRRMELLNRKKIIMKELNQINNNDPIKLIDESYARDKYNTMLLGEEIKEIDNIFRDHSYNVLIEKKEKLEMNKKVIDYYLNFVVEQNFDAIMRALYKVNLNEKNLEECFQKVVESKSKVKNLKAHILKTSARYLLLKQKLSNLIKIHKIIKEKFLKWLDIFKSSKQLKAEKKFTELFENYKNLNDEIYKRVNQNDSLFFKKGLVINNVLMKKSEGKMDKLKKMIENEKTNLFVEKKHNFKQIHEFMMKVSNLTNDKFVDELCDIFKSTIFNIIKGTLNSFTEESRSYLVLDINKIKDIAKLKYDEVKFLGALNQLLINFTHSCQCYNNYMTMENTKGNKDSIFANLESKRSQFYELMEKKYSKVMKSFGNFIKELGIKHLVILVVYNSLFSELIKFLFKLEYSKYLHLQTKNVVLENLRFQTVTNIKKVGILIEGDNWRRVALQEEHEFFHIKKAEEKVPLKARSFITIFNEEDLGVNRKNIKDKFFKLMDDFNLYVNPKDNFFFYEESEVQNKTVLSKPFSNKSIILSSSTVNLFTSMFDLVIYMIFMDSIVFETFTNIFYLVDYYILASVNMFVDKKYFLLLLEDVNFEEMKKKGKLEQASDNIFFQKNYANLRKYVLQSKKNLEGLFDLEIDLLKNNYHTNDTLEFGDFHLPKINTQILVNDSNVYSLLIESIVLYESILGTVKVLKRLKHFTKKIDLEFQSKFLLGRIEDYSKVIQELKSFIYKPICSNIFRIDPILKKIENYKWDPKEDDSINSFSEANPFIENLFQEICEKYGKLDLLSGGSLTEKSKQRFLDIMLMYVIDRMTESFSKLKKCNSFGRSIMLKDIKFFKSKMENKFNRDFHRFFGEIELYINSWYCSEDEFLKYIEDSHLSYKNAHGIINTGQNFCKLKSSQKKDFQARLDETYYNILDNIKISMIDN